MRTFVTCLLCLVVAALLPGCGGSEPRGPDARDKALERGYAFYEQGEFEKARLEFRNALQADPGSAEARYQSGRVAEQLRDYRAAASFFRGAVDADPTHTAARADLARAYLMAGAPEQALETVAPGLETTPDEPRLLVVRAGARVALRDVAGAFQDAERAFELAPENPDAIAMLAGLYDTNARSDRARTLLEGGVAAHPRNAQLRVALAELYSSLDLPAEAERHLRELAVLEPGVSGHRLRHARLLTSQRRIDEAEATLRAALRAFPDDREVRAGLVGFLRAHRGDAAAEAQLRAFVDGAKNAYEPVLALAAFQVETGTPEKAEALLRDLISRDATRPGGLAARVQLASILSARGDAPGAAKLVDEVLAVNPRDGGALLMRAAARLAQDPRAAIADLRVVLRDEPGSLIAMRSLAAAHVANAEPELALETLRRAIEVDPRDRAARLELARVLADRGNQDQAQPIVDALLRELPADPAVLELAYRTAVARRDVAAAKSAADGLLAASPTAPISHLYAGIVAESERRNEDAERAYRRALELQPSAAEPLQALTNLLVRTGRIDLALRQLDATAAREPESALPLLMKGQALLGERRFVEARRAFEAGAAREPTSWVLHRGAAVAALGAGDRPMAMQILEKAIPGSNQPNALRADLADLRAQAGDFDAAISLYETIVREAPGLAIAKAKLAALLASHRTDAASLQQAASLVAGFEQSSDANLLEAHGWVALKRGDAKAAVAALERARRDAPNSASVLYRLGTAQAVAGDVGAARVTLQSVIARGPQTPTYADAKAAIERLSATP